MVTAIIFVTFFGSFAIFRAMELTKENEKLRKENEKLRKERR